MNTLTDRSVAVMRMHLVDRVTLIVLPTGILGSVLAINLALWLVVPPDGRQTGGASALWFFVLVAAMLAVVKGLPFALGMGSSRRAFTLGTGLAGLVLAVGFGTFALLLQTIERVTDGWGRQGNFFWFDWFSGTVWPLIWLLLVVSIFAAFSLGTLIASIWARWNIAGLIVGGPATVLVAGGLVVLVTWRHRWDEIGGWFGGLTPATTTGWCAVAAVACSLATWGVLRRARA